MDVGGNPRAQLKFTGARSKRGDWIDLDQEFNGNRYLLEEIDAENNTVVVYDQTTGERHTLSP